MMRARSKPARQSAAAVASAGKSPRSTTASPLDGSPRILQQKSALDAIHGSPRMFQQKSALDALQATAHSPVQRISQPLTPEPNRTGLPDQLKAGVESLSGLSMAHVRVRYNSAAPAQLNALAFAQGSDIHIGPGHEKHLPHEAWHVVQQSQGRVSATRPLREGVALNDDPGLEREADLMGQRALQMTAAPHGLALAPDSGPDGRSGPRPVVRQQHRIMQRATDREALRRTRALPEFQFESLGTKTVEDLIDLRDEQMGGVKRDANKNNLVKRGFEDALATFVFHRWDLVGPVVLKVSKLVLTYFEERFVVTKAVSLLESMQAIQEQPNTLGSTGFMPKSAEEGAKILLDQIPASLPTHLNVHGKFSYVIYSGKSKDFDDGTAQKILDLHKRDETAQNHFEQLFPPALTSAEEKFQKDPEQGRPRLPNPKKEEMGLAPHLSGLAPDPGVKAEWLKVPPDIDGRPTSSEQRHARGGDAFFVDETKRWTQEARLLYDMPVMAGPSGSAAYMINTAMVLGLPSKQLPTYTMALVGSIVGGGHHTFHEIMTVAAQVGVPYVPGNYLSAIPAPFWKDGGFQDLAHRFFEPVKDFSGRTRSDDSTPTKKTSQQLQFGLPPIVDDGMISMRHKIAARLGKTPEDIAVKPINDGGQTKGVSGSPVFRVTCNGKPVGVVKVFQEFAEMAQELSAMATINSLRLPHLVAPEVLGIGKLVKGSIGSLVKDRELGYVFSSIAAGQPLDDLMKDVGTATGSPREEALGSLHTAVVNVATQLANLHNHPGSGGTVGAAFIKLHIDKVSAYAIKAATDEQVKLALDGFDLVVLATDISERFKKNAGPASLSHGDAHPGNFFHDDQTVTAIDTPTMDTSIGKNGPIGSPARDVTNFNIKLNTVGRGFQLTPDEINALQTSFIKTYKSLGKLEITPEAVRFFHLRTLLSELKTAIEDTKGDDLLRLVQAIKTL